jgi:CCR4-NOT complex subunit CAF16
MLIELLNIKRDGSMHQLSDGQRQGVQIAAALMKPFKVLLMDETTVECDVLVRKHLLAYLKRKTEEEKATIMYATHVFDGMAAWPTHIMHVSGGRITVEVLKDNAEYQAMCSSWDPSKDSPLSHLVETWLERDWQKKLEADKEARNRPKEKTVEEKLAETRDTNVGDRFYNYWN